MKFTTSIGQDYNVDLRARTVSTGPDEGFGFHWLVGAYVGSKSAAFLDADGDIILQTGEVVSVEADPNEAVSGEEGNVVFLTQNSTYEINQEQKLFRRLAGLNAPTKSQGLDGDWQPYVEIVDLEVGKSPLIFRPGRPLQPAYLTRVREIRGTLVSTPTPGAAL